MDYQYITPYSKLGYYKQNHDNLEIDYQNMDRISLQILELAGVIIHPEVEPPAWVWSQEANTYVRPPQVEVTHPEGNFLGADRDPEAAE